jgi:hypothetical protein
MNFLASTRRGVIQDGHNLTMLIQSGVDRAGKPLGLPYGSPIDASGRVAQLVEFDAASQRGRCL